MDLGLKGKVAVVTGASQGLGKATALSLAREGCNLVINSRNPEKIEATAAEIRAATGAQVVAVAADVAIAEGCEQVVRAAYDRFGRADILIVNAGGPPAGFFSKFTDADWQKAFDLTLMSAVRLVRGVLPQMQAQKWGRIVLIASGSIKVPIPSLLFSNVFRAGAAQLMKTLSREVAKDGVTINTVCPGRIDTERVRFLDEFNAKNAGKTAEEIKAAELTGIPAGRYGTTEEYANAVAFICSEAASYITGVTLQVDGGQNRFIY